MLKIARILTDYETEPVGVGHVPAFSWEAQSDRRNVRQQSYRLQLAAAPDFAAPVYDSGTVRSAQSVQVAPPQGCLASATRYYVRVQIADECEQSAWSAPASFVTALLTAAEWTAPFVSAEDGAADRALSKGTYVRGTFRVRPGLCAAYAFTTAHGLYQFYLNGEKVGQDEMAPGWTSYRSHLTYQTCDITACLREGLNTAGALLGAGWYKGAMGLTKARCNYGERTAFAMQAVLCYRDGTRETVTTDAGWRGADAPVVFAEIYDGETYDAARELAGWAENGTPAGAWHAVHAEPAQPGILAAQPAGRVRVQEKLPAQAVFRTPKGETVVDFGQNLAGWVEFTAAGRAGDTVEIRCFEVLDAAGNVYLDNLRGAKTTLRYTFARSETVTWRPHFTYMGFRYGLILSWPGEPRAENFTACVLHSQMERTGTLTCSNALLNQLHHNFLWGLRSNFLDVPTDCPQRDERLGWTGDAQIFCRTAGYLMNTDTFFSKWLTDLAADQRPGGGVPHVIPDIEKGHEQDNWLLQNSPHSASAWGDAAVIIPWTQYLLYGDKEILRRQYASMKGWIDFMQAHAQGCVWGYKMQLGDWLALDAAEGSYFGATPTELTCMAYYAYSTGLFVKTARALGRGEDAAQYAALYEKIRAAFRAAYFTADGDMTVHTQTAHILALYFDLAPAQHRARTAAALCGLLAQRGGHLATGFIGTPYFCFALSENGCTAQAYELLLREDFPSWLYQVKRGATTVWEHWDGLKPDGTMWSADMNSFNHYAYGAIGEWMYRVMAGIDTDEAAPGFAHSILWPRMGGGLQWVKGACHTVYGPLACSWEQQGETVTLRAAIPPNTTAALRLDGARQVLCTDGLAFVARDGYWEAQAGSGSYEIVFVRGAAGKGETKC